MKKLLTVALLLLPSSIVLAGQSTGKVPSLLVHAGDTVMFTAGEHTNKPACSTMANDWAFSLKTDTGKAMYSLLLSAAAQKKTVTVEGSGECAAWGDRESPTYISINY